MNSRSAKARCVQERIKSIELSLLRGHEYLEHSQHADWHRFRPLFDVKWRGDRQLPPHKDWVRNVFIPRHERALVKAEKVLERLEQLDSSPAGQLAHAGDERRAKAPDRRAAEDQSSREADALDRAAHA